MKTSELVGVERTEGSVRVSYVERFGEDQAVALELATQEHKNGIHDKPGSDPFKWALLIAIGFECISRPDFRDYHGITVPFDDIKAWDHADLATHDGECDYITLMVGGYNDWVKREVSA